jgi:hypothetical protein
MAERFVPYQQCGNPACSECWSVRDNVLDGIVCACELPVARTICRLLNREYGARITDIGDNGRPINGSH